MTINEHEELGYLTLKQASERFGYSPDYIGQLIRKGKIEGKQVYANVAWVTTEAAMEEYIAGNTPTLSLEKNDVPLLDRAGETLFSKRSIAVLEWALRFIFALLLVIGLFVFYFLSISIDDHLAKNAEQALALRVQSEVLHIPPVITPPQYVAYGE